MLWLFFLALPMFIIYSIGIPLVAFILLCKRRKSLEEWETKRYFLMIYQGLRQERFYWEFVNTLRKILILFTIIIFSQISSFYKIITVVILLITFYRLQIWLKPYKRERNNSLERLEMISGMFTIYGGLIFMNENNNQASLDLMVFVFIVF